jgi:hypothetical protein
MICRKNIFSILTSCGFLISIIFALGYYIFTASSFGYMHLLASCIGGMCIIGLIIWILVLCSYTNHPMPIFICSCLFCHKIIEDKCKEKTRTCRKRPIVFNNSASNVNTSGNPKSETVYSVE